MPVFLVFFGNARKDGNLLTKEVLAENPEEALLKINEHIREVFPYPSNIKIWSAIDGNGKRVFEEVAPI